ncbi:hypothetical protein [Hymenobacter psychrotolerans]|uniref:Uncharacterized protein n=1 Tax=Hymenobacter psychrotolerans DSM 18569 TaxID=1121959 RepID=A0A1M7GE06_9BACT|nr:hypothetical protein [Hymenobacter psychrotolerans]SHM14365.1 hypothetical protein SAMN02746009_04023 [Hymenobacter psychrotolerans DSM 18569]
MILRYSLPFCLLLTAGCARQKFFQPDARPEPTALAARPDSVVVTAGRHYRRGPIGRFLLGQHHRTAWAQPVTLPVLDAATTVPGGLRAGKIGGGFQTISMTVVGADGRSYALRSIDKDPYRTLPKVLRHTFVLNLVRDATAAGHPYGAFVVPPLAEAAGVRHTKPRAYYVRPDETGFGEASARYHGRVVLLEEKLEGKQNIAGRLPGATDLDESDTMLEARYKSPKNTVHEAAFLRARLLDLWLGDWDRHEGQWTWAAYPQAQGQTRWEPIPQDRDQVFFRFDDGVLSWLVSKVVPKFRTFGPRYESIEGYTRNSRYIDAHVLTELDRRTYLATARDLQRRLSDSVITSAVRQGLPQAVFRQEGPRMIAALQARRDALPKAAADYYRLRARTVLVAGTDADERFVVERLNDTATVVSVYELKPSAKRPDSLLYRRVFHPAETRTVQLHGLQGDDEFELRGSVRRSPFIAIYGGPHEDKVRDESRVAGLRRRTRFYDTSRNNDVGPAPELKDKTSHGVGSHAFDRDGSGR